MKTLFAVPWVDVEYGWGSKPDGFKVFDDLDSCITTTKEDSDNGITLCQDHHLLCENFVINQIFEYSPENLYKLINSSYDLSLINSQKLNT
jgi:hypothetical protein